MIHQHLTIRFYGVQNTISVEGRREQLWINILMFVINVLSLVFQVIEINKVHDMHNNALQEV